MILVVQVEYHVLFQAIDNNINDEHLTFVVNHMKSRITSVVYFVLHCYDMNGNEILVANKPAYIGKRWVVDASYSKYMEKFKLSSRVLSKTSKVQVELVAINIDDNNPLYFNQCMLTDKDFTEYHKTDEAMEIAHISLIKNGYVNMYMNKTENFLQIMRPSKKSFSTKTLSANDITVIAPHIPNEPQADEPTNLFIEFLNQTEQNTNIVDSFKMG